MIYFTSDTHFCHSNVIEYCNRPFIDVFDMNAQMMAWWNETVGPDDTVYHLGDFALGPGFNIGPIRQLLNGRIILIRGNHDRSANTMKNKGFDEVHHDLVADIDGVKVYMRHKPRYDWKEKVVADFHFCGHVHESWSSANSMGGATIYNVGVDVRRFTPRTFNDIITGAS